MSGLRYFALKRLSLQDMEGEPLTVEAGEFIPEELVNAWGDRGVHPAVATGRIAPLPASLADLVEAAVTRRRVKTAA